MTIPLDLLIAVSPLLLLFALWIIGDWSKTAISSRIGWCWRSLGAARPARS